MYTDETILNLLKQDIEKGSTVLVAQYSALLHSICADKLENEEDIKECVNDTFADFLINYKSYDSSRGNLKNYLCAIAKHKSVDKYRQNLHRSELNKELIEKYKEEQYFPAECSKEMIQLENAMEKLPPLEQQILQMHYYEDKSYKEISDELGINYEKVRKRGLRGKKKLLYIILLGLLILSITACTTIVMKKHGLLPTWFPFYDMIPDLSPEKDSEEDEKDEQNEKKTMDTLTTYPEDILNSDMEESEEEETDQSTAVFPTENEITEEKPKQTAKKYQVSSNKGLIWSDSPAYEMSSDTQTYTKDDVTYELQSVFYQDGEWELSFLISCSDEERTKEHGASIDSPPDKIVEALEYSDENPGWIVEEQTRLKSAYFQNENENKATLSFLRASMVAGYPSNTVYSCVYGCSWTPANVNIENDSFTIFLIFPEGKKFEIVMKKLDVKDYVDTTDESKETISESEQVISEFITLTPGIAEIKNGMAVITLNQDNIQEYQVADIITQSYYGFIDREPAKMYLTAKDGTKYELMRVSKQVSETGNGTRNIFEIYFRGVEPGEYTLEVPNVCLQKDMTSEMITLPLPTGEDNYLECDLTVPFSDGTAVHITGVERSEQIKYIYYNEYGAISFEEIHFWNYDLIFECISVENNPEFCYVLSKGMSSNEISTIATTTLVDGKKVYRYGVQSDEMPEYLNVEFYSPFYILNQEFAFDFVLTE